MLNQRPEAHIYFSDSIGMGDWFYGTTLNDVRYCVEGWAAYDGGRAADNELPAKVVLHFPYCLGGSVPEGYGIFNYLRELAARGVAVEARIEGYCASIAVLIALAADTILMADAALLMVHKPSSSGDGDADYLREQADILDKIQAQLVGRYVARGVKDAATANELINRTSTLNADECLALGFITGKLHEEPITVPTGADAVLNYFPTNKKPAMAISPAEKKSIVDDVINGIKGFFKNEAPAPAPEPVTLPVTNASSEVPGGETMYYDGELATGTAVYTDEALTMAYPDGSPVLADGRTVTVAAGLVESIADATNAADDAAAANSAELEAANATIADLQDKLNTANQKVVGLTNKLKTVVPGSTGNPTPAGSVLNIGPKCPPAKNNSASPFKVTRS